MALPSFIGNATNDIDPTKQSGHAISKTDIDVRDNSNRTYQYKAVLLHEFISVEVSLIYFHIIKFSRLCVPYTEPTFDSWDFRFFFSPFLYPYLSE